MQFPPLDVDAQFFRNLYDLVNLRLWTFLIPVAGAIVGSYLGILAFYVTRAILSGIQRKKVRLERRAEEAQHQVLSVKAELADTLKENRRLRRELEAKEAEFAEVLAKRRAIIELAGRRVGGK